MERFAKLFETPTTQVLFFIALDKYDQPILHAMGRSHDGAEFDLCGEFPSDEAAQAALAECDQAMAESIAAKVLSVIPDRPESRK